ncbi:hypothetical protein ACFVX9_30420 [Kitasatospora sp. NPDC058243]|uniref:hypothetical protein n=1 Tax=Kitasatospora sp. NPDC058243 TaxID=3346397 RepID=UPI0036DA3B70
MPEMSNYLQDSLTLHAETLAAWNESRAKARQIKDPKERAAALEALKGQRPVHPYLGGISLAALRWGNHRMLSPLKTRHADAKAEHAETLAAWKERRARAREIKDPEQRAKTLEDLKGERPTHPALIAAGCAVVSAVLLAGVPAARHAVHHYGAVSITSGLTLWVITALILGQKATPDHAQRPPAKQAGKNAPEEADQEAEETVPTAAETRVLAASLTADGTSVLLTRLAADLASAHPFWETSTKGVRALLSQAGVPVREGVRTPHGNGPGVHHQDVTKLPSPSQEGDGAPVVANVGAGQSANANANNADETEPQQEFTTVPHPTDPARTIVVHSVGAA